LIEYTDSLDKNQNNSHADTEAFVNHSLVKALQAVLGQDDPAWVGLEEKSEKKALIWKPAPGRLHSRSFFPIIKFTKKGEKVPPLFFSSPDFAYSTG